MESTLRQASSTGRLAAASIWAPAAWVMQYLTLPLKMLLTLSSLAIPAIWLAAQAARVVGPLHAWSILAGGLTLAGYFSIGQHLSVNGAIAALRRHIMKLSQGDLRAEIDSAGRDEIASLKREISSMQASLRDTVEVVLKSSSTVVESSMEIAAGAQDLSNRVDSAAAALEQSSAALEQSASTTAHTAQAVEKASELASHNADLAQRGGHVVQDVIQTMERIQTSSRKVNEIIRVIDSIAFQTNILALNAAVEAAGAKEHGRGFAVVASEVRGLAQRSAAAAREIKQLIDASVDEVNQGVSVARNAGSAMEEIVDASDQVRVLMDDVSRAAREQSLGIAEVGTAIQQLDQNTQANAALVEQTATTAALQQEAAISMAAMVDEFRLPGQARDATGVDVYIDAHRQWKVKLNDAIEARSTIDANTLRRDDCCALGKWIHGNGEQSYGQSPRFSELKERHRVFHVVAGDVADQINAGQYTQAKDAIASNTRYNEATRAVVRVLSFIKRLGFD